MQTSKSNNSSSASLFTAAGGRRWRRKDGPAGAALQQGQAAFPADRRGAGSAPRFNPSSSCGSSPTTGLGSAAPTPPSGVGCASFPSPSRFLPPNAIVTCPTSCGPNCPASWLGRFAAVAKQREGLGQPAAVHTATTGWQKEMDHLKKFVAEELKWFRARVFDAVTGSIAEAIFTKRTFHDVWNGHQAEGDLMMFRLSSHEID
jgi:hypothetical protein